jgi:LytS/YehU family sensor histidine kinase
VTLPFTAIMLLNLTGAIRRRRQLSRKTFLSFLVAFVPMTLALVIHLFVDVFPLIYISTVLSSLSMYGLILSDQMEQELNHQQEISNQRSSILVLQMRPHFIYNTLMTIYSLCNQDPQKARQVTADFTDYLRKNFNALASETPIPFSAELEHTRAYLAVEQAQHKQLLHVEYDTQFTFFRVPPLTLQPIAENAVKHGLDPYRGALHIMIRTCRTDKASVIVVEDNGPGFDAAQQSEAHTALTNIRQRLELMCDGKMEITAREEGGTRVTIRIPLRGTQGD